MGSDLSAALVGLPCAVLGFLVLVRTPDRVTGWLLLVIGSGLTLPLFTSQLVLLTDPGPRMVLWAHLFAHLCSLADGYAMVMLPLTFPAERRAGPFVHCYAGALLVVCVVLVAVATGVEEPPGGGPHPLLGTAWRDAALTVLEPCVTANLWLILICAVINVSIVVSRWRRADRSARREALAFAAAYFPWTYGDFAEEIPGMPAWSVYAAFATGAAGWYAAVAYVIGRGAIWQLDRTGRRLLITAVVVTAVVLTYTAAAVAVSTVLPGAGSAGAFAVAVVAVVIGSGLRPLTGWASRRVDHLFNGLRSEPSDAVRGLARRLREAPEPEDVPAVLCRSATDDLRFPAAVVAVGTRSGPHTLATAGGHWDAREAYEFPLRHRGQVIGTLRVAPRPGETSLPDRDAELLQLLSDQAAPALAALQLLEDVRAARQQVVMAREEERRRLRRELHDGLGPLLAAARLHLDTTLAVGAPAATTTAAEDDRAAAPRTAPDVTELLLPAVAAVTEAAAEARRIANGLGPAVLSERDLGFALRDLAHRLDGPGMAVGVHLEPATLPPLPAAVERAVYRIAAEALANAVRHAGASRCEVAVTAGRSTVLLTVGDNGSGLPARVRPGGVGLGSMAERARELGGSFEVVSDARGTSVRALLPTAGDTAGAVPRPAGTGTGQGGDQGLIRPGHRAAEAGWEHRSRT
ncbi:ATP-binding protein [Streptomyces sp. NPDC050703]|uniref:sensor histidine kinase n=1 Tax=Streptomyces sp. NPDC050703 TaxID=3157218 RepID=UPI00343A16B0